MQLNLFRIETLNSAYQGDRMSEASGRELANNMTTVRAVAYFPFICARNEKNRSGSTSLFRLIPISELIV